MFAHYRDKVLKINRLWRTRSIASIPCKILGYKNIRLKIKSDVFCIVYFFCDGVWGGKVILRGRTLGPKLGA